MNKRIINKAAVYILKAIKYSNNKLPLPKPFPLSPKLFNILIDKAIDHLENNQ